MTENMAVRVIELRAILPGNSKRIICRLFAGCRRATAQLLVMPAIFCGWSPVYAADAPRLAYTPPPPAVSSGNIAQIIFSLLLVLAAIVLVAWLLKRMNVAQHGTGKLLKVLGAVPIGQRERIVLVEVNDTCLVVGVGPGQIRTLHTFQKNELQMMPASEQVPGNQGDSSLYPTNKFASLLTSVLNNRRPKTTEK